MKKIYLCGHTGSVNRGCEAIVRGSVEVFRQCGITDIALVTANKKQDENAGLDEVVHLIEFPRKTLLEKVIARIKRQFFHDGVWGVKRSYMRLFHQIEKDALLLNIGGDTYCYGTPYISYAFNQLATQQCRNTLFWGCSVEERLLADKQMIADVNRYPKIAVREKLSQEVFLQAITDKTKIHKICDPAFHLPIHETALPKFFKQGDTLGLNVSPLVFNNLQDEEDITYKNVYALIDYVLACTQTNICLIPHVYDSTKNLQDIKVLRKMYARYANTGRVSIVEEELSCTQLKYIIANCRYFIGARTHSTIAAYSSAVPCVAISYSIKSRGIAKDLFGTDEGFALPYKKWTDENVLKNAFIHTLVAREEEIKATYQAVLPSYKQSIIKETRNIIEQLL